MVKFYRRNISHMKCKSSVFLVTTILCISSTQLLLCSARPNQDLSDISNEKPAGTNADVVKALDELPVIPPETKKHKDNEDEISRQGGTIDDVEPDNVEDTEEGNGGEEEEGNDYEDEHTGPVVSFTELKTTPLPTRPTRAPARKNVDTDLEDDYEQPEEDEGGDEAETMPPRTSSTSTTEEPTPLRPLRTSPTREDENSSESDELINEATTAKAPLLAISSGLKIRNYSSLLFVPVLMYFLA